MSIEDIKNLPIQNISDESCILFLWATFPLLQEALDTIKAWGFKYKTIGFNWIKKNKKSDSLFWGMGNFTRSNSEICLIGTKGKPNREAANVHSVLMSPIEQHSKKPDIIRNLIVQLCGDKPRIELFARQISPGWDAMGFNISGKDIREELNEKQI